MDKQRIWRLETAEGVGPFEYGNHLMHSDISAEEKQRFGDEEAAALGWTEMVSELTFMNGGIGFVHHLNIPPDHPHHMADAEPGDDVHTWKVGTKDEQQFLHWFPKTSWPFFEKRGFQLSLYDVPKDNVHFGEYQLLYCADGAELVERRPLIP